jgi:hypothetical protein
LKGFTLKRLRSHSAQAIPLAQATAGHPDAAAVRNPEACGRAAAGRYLPLCAD